jgi:hypothetical protein
MAASLSTARRGIALSRDRIPTRGIFKGVFHINDDAFEAGHLPSSLWIRAVAVHFWRSLACRRSAWRTPREYLAQRGRLLGSVAD